MLCALIATAVAVSGQAAASQVANPVNPAAAATRYVPQGETYVLYNASGGSLGSFPGGTRLPARTTDCVQIKCPKAISSAGGRVRCWRCGRS